MSLVGIAKSVLGEGYKMFLIQARQKYEQARSYYTADVQEEDRVHMKAYPASFDILLWALRMEKN